MTVDVWVTGLSGDDLRADAGLLAEAARRQTQVQRRRQNARQVQTVSRATYSSRGSAVRRHRPQHQRAP